MMSLNGTVYPSYSALDVTRNQPAISGDTTATDQVTLSLSFLPHQDNVFLFAAIDNVSVYSATTL